MPPQSRTKDEGRQRHLVAAKQSSRRSLSGASLTSDPIMVSIEVVGVISFGVGKWTGYKTRSIAASPGAINVTVNWHARTRVVGIAFSDALTCPASISGIAGPCSLQYFERGKQHQAC
jgi:hypothetical protein